MITLTSVQAFCYRYPLSTPVVTSFGRMSDRPAVFIRVEDADGMVGWGEAWCNFPTVGAEHRARLINESLGLLVTGAAFADPAALFARLSAATAVLALQSGEAGPFAQAIAGIDIAVWDLCARREGVPLWRLLGGESPTVGVYASGINPTGSAAMAERALAAGHRAFKLKIGFDAATDDANIAAIRAVIGGLPLAVDANQAWDCATAARRAAELGAMGLAWLEEPLRADRPRAEWRTVGEAGGPPLAAGENVTGLDGFDALLDEGVIAVVQPDMAKWGGFSAGIPVARAVRAAGRQFFPHYLGGGIGLLASAHLLAAAGGEGRLEVDVNDNPLRDLTCGPVARIFDGRITLDEAPGLGFAPDLAALAPWRRM